MFACLNWSLEQRPSRVGAPGCFVVELFAFYLLLGDWGLLNGGFLLMNLAILRRVSVCFISFFVRIGL